MRAREFTIKLHTAQPEANTNCVDQPFEPDEQDSEGDNVGIFVPPLQQQLELLKKEAGVDSIYDTEDPQNKSESMPNKSNNYETNPRALVHQAIRQMR